MLPANEIGTTYFITSKMVSTAIALCLAVVLDRSASAIGVQTKKLSWSKHICASKSKMPEEPGDTCIGPFSNGHPSLAK